MTYARQIAEWAAGLRFNDIPDAVIADEKLRVLDILGVALAASTLPASAPVRTAALRLGASQESMMWGYGDRTTAATAAMVNGSLAHALDYDDTHNESVVHISAPVVTTGLTLGEALGSDGRAVLAAIVAGAELGCRIGRVAPGEFHKRGFHATGVMGAFAAAVTASKLLDLKADQLRNAIGIAGSQASGLLEGFRDGSAVKQLHPGWAAHAGIIAAYLAQDGFTGPATVFEGRDGLYNSHVGSHDYPVDRMTEGLGDEWTCLHTSFKPYPCGHVVHGFLDAVLALYHEEGLRATHVEKITCPTAEWMIPIMCEPRALKLKPETDYHAKFSFYFTMAATLLDGRLGVEVFTEANIRNPDILSLAEKIHCIPDPDAPGTGHFKGWVQVDTADGRRLEHVVDDNWGSLANPMTPDQVQTKFRDNAGLALGEERITRIIGDSQNLEAATDVSAMIALCST
ncbi:MAG: MmgE/PrpD family protein [Candidatus Tectomicrobia bacterium]